jgi:hypothetical protein
MGTLGVGIMNSMAFSLLANSSPEVNENQISFGTIDFQPHPSNFTPIFKSLDQDMDLTIGSPTLLRRIFRFDSPFRSGETGSVGKRSQDNCNV